MTKRIEKTMVALMVVLAMVIAATLPVQAASFTEAANYTCNGQKLSITSMGQIVYTAEDGRTKELTREKLGLATAFSNDGIVYYEMLDKSIYFYSFDIQGIDGEPMLYERGVTGLELTGSGESTRITGYTTKEGSQPLITIAELKFLLAMGGDSSSSSSSATDNSSSSSSSQSSSSTTDNSSSSSSSQSSSSTTDNSSSSSSSQSSSRTTNNSSSSSNSGSNSNSTTKVTVIVKNTKYTYAYTCKVKGNKVILKDNKNKKVDEFKLKGTKLTYKNHKYKKIKVAFAFFNEKGNVVLVTKKGELKVVDHITGKMRTIRKKSVKGIRFVKKTRIAKKYILKSGKMKSLRKF